MIYPRVHGSEICVQVLYDVVLLEEVPTRVTGVSKKVKPCVVHVCILPQLQFYPLNDISMCFIDIGTCLHPKNKILKICRGRCFDTTCKVPNRNVQSNSTNIS